MLRQRRAAAVLVVWIASSLLLLTLLFSLTQTTAAQQGDGAGDDTQSSPNDRTTPRPRAVILERTPLEGDAMQLLVEVPAIADTYIASNAPGNNYSSDDDLYVGYNNVLGAERTLLKFDVENEIPAGAYIHDATLELFLRSASPADDDPMPIIVRDLRTPWQETTVTWSTEPKWGGTHDTANIATTTGYYAWDVTGLVSDWVDGSLANNGVEIAGDEGQAAARERVFYTRADSTHTPRLVVNYETVAPDVRVDPLPAYSPITFTVSWTNFGGNARQYDVQFRLNGGAWVDWLTDVAPDVTSADFTASEDGQYEFRARGENHVAEPFGDPEATTVVDTSLPVTTVDPLPHITAQSSFTVSWSSSDEDRASVAYYDVQYRLNDGPWTPWQQQTVATRTLFTAMRDGFFEFEARAVDDVGNVEPFRNEPEANIIVDAKAPFIGPKLWLPLVARH